MIKLNKSDEGTIDRKYGFCSDFVYKMALIHNNK